MVVSYRVIGWLGNHLTTDQKQGTLEIGDGSIVRDVCAKIGLNVKFHIVILINNRIAKTEHLLQTDDRITIIPGGISGG